MTHNDEEFAALRSTIRDRGTVRMILLPVTFGLWAGFGRRDDRRHPAADRRPGPLLVLAAELRSDLRPARQRRSASGATCRSFTSPDGGWEHVAMTFGERFPSRGPDALFSALFLMATALNYLPVALGGTPPKWSPPACFISCWRSHRHRAQPRRSNAKLDLRTISRQSKRDSPRLAPR